LENGFTKQNWSSFQDLFNSTPFDTEEVSDTEITEGGNDEESVS
jgi:hypothetical protein